MVRGSPSAAGGWERYATRADELLRVVALVGVALCWLELNVPVLPGSARVPAPVGRRE